MKEYVMSGKLFEVAIMEKPTHEDAKLGKLSVLKFGPKAIVAKDAHGAAVHAVLDGAAKDVDRDRMEVIVRPFGY
jgi:hypothetical protein